MSGLPLWAQASTALMVLLGAGFALIGSFGLLRFGTFYERVHAPTLGTTLGTGCVVAASTLCFSVLGDGPILQALVIGVFSIIATPVALIVLIGAARRRERASGSDPGPS